MSTDILDGLSDIPWADLEHAYGSALDVPELLRKLLDPDAKVRSKTMGTLYGNVFHQGTRYPATPYVVPFLIKLCASPSVPARHDLLHYWSSLITGFFSVQERPCWGDGERVYWHSGKAMSAAEYEELADYERPYVLALHQIYLESLRGFDLLCELIQDDEVGVRAGAVSVLACLPTMSEVSGPLLDNHIKNETSGWVRAAIAFALGELNMTSSLHRLLQEDEFPAVRCMAACQLARSEPTDDLTNTLLEFVNDEINGYSGIPGAGGKSTGDAAYSLTALPKKSQQKALPALLRQLKKVRSFDKYPIMEALLSAVFQPSQDELTVLTALQTEVLTELVNHSELAGIGWVMGSYGLPMSRDGCAALLDIQLVKDEALETLRSGISFSEIGFLDKAQGEILKALELDSTVFERVSAPDECWLLYAKAFATSAPERALSGFAKAVEINPWVVRRVDPDWSLADLLIENGIEYDGRK